MSFLATASAVAGIVSAGVGAAKAIHGGIQASKAKKDEAKAKAELDKQRNLFANVDTSNPYLNMENVYEDLTVNQQAADFQKQQSMQTQANTMQQMRGAAGGSGIAALAQAMAQQGSKDAQQASVSIAEQEQANQLKTAEEAGRLQDAEREGEMISREAQFGKISSMMGMAAGDLSGARARRQAGQEAVMGGVKDMATAGFDYAENMGMIDGQLIQDYRIEGLQNTTNTN